MPIQRKNVVDFADIFMYAETKFGLAWNSCCTMFHSNELLRYKSTNEFDFDWLS